MKLIKNQKGQGVLEYIIITSLIGITCLIAMKQFGQVVKHRIDGMKSKISKEIRIN